MTVNHSPSLIFMAVFHHTSLVALSGVVTVCARIELSILHSSIKQVYDCTFNPKIHVIHFCTKKSQHHVASFF